MSAPPDPPTPPAPQEPPPPARVPLLSGHILPTSATMIGVCITVISVVRLLEVSGSVGTIIDDIIALDSLLFLGAAMLSYLSMRSARQRSRLEAIADLIFMAALSVIAIASVMLALEVGYTAH